MYVFYAATRGLETQLAEVLTKKEYFGLASDEFPNCNWFSVKIKDARRQDEWVEAYNNMLHGQWTPNQDRADREYYRKMINEAMAVMAEIEA